MAGAVNFELVHNFLDYLGGLHGWGGLEARLGQPGGTAWERGLGAQLGGSWDRPQAAQAAHWPRDWGISSFTFHQ